MCRKNERKYKLSLMLLVTSCLCCCAKVSCEQPLKPVFPHGGAPVADELQNLSAEEYPHLWEWLARLNKLRLELENNEEDKKND